MAVQKINDLNPDGVIVSVNWDAMVIGASFFVPCVNTEAAIKQVKKITDTFKWDVEYRVVTQDNKLGVRVWRVL
jgi:hypothetical protein